MGGPLGRSNRHKHFLSVTPPDTGRARQNKSKNDLQIQFMDEMFAQILGFVRCDGKHSMESRAQRKAPDRAGRIHAYGFAG